MGKSRVWQGGEGAVVQLDGAEGGEGRDGIQVHRVRGQVKLLGKRERGEEGIAMLQHRKILVQSSRD